MNHVHCANPHCKAKCGIEHASTYSDPGYVDLHAGAVIDDRTGEVFCSQECYDEYHPNYCAECGDNNVERAAVRIA